MDTLTVNKPAAAATEDFLPLLGTDHVEFYVGNAKQSAYYYQSAWGYELIAYAGPETGVRDRASYVLQQGKIRIVLTTPMHPDHEIAAYQLQHGDSVKVLALWVDDATKAFEETTKRGAKAVMNPVKVTDEHGEVVISAIQTYGQTIHKFIERKNYKGAFLPGYQPRQSSVPVKSVGLKHVDHCVGNVGWNRMDHWVNFYEQVMGFRNILSFDDNDISTEYSALMSKVVANGNHRVKFPLNEPAEGKRKSQIDEYLEFYGGPGVQHVALATNDIVATVDAMVAEGIEFLTTPDSYYEDPELRSRIGNVRVPIEELQRRGILVDRDEDGYLLQIFTKPTGDRPTVFFELIERHGSLGFGKGNFKALFEAIEREQANRGNF